MNILIVEDQPVVAMHMKMILADHGHVVGRIARTAGEAVRFATDEIQLVLLDSHLAEGTSGMDAAEELKGFACLFVTSDCPPEAASLAMGCLSKPFSDGELVAAVHVCEDLLAGEDVPPGDIPNHMELFH